MSQNSALSPNQWPRRKAVPPDGPLALDDLANTVPWHLELTGQSGRGDAGFLRLVREDFAGKNGGSAHGRLRVLRVLWG